MKRLFTFVIVMTLLCHVAMADSVRQQVNAPEHTTGEWFSNTGLTHIIVDAQVIVPDVNSVSVYAVEGRDTTASDARAMALTVIPGTDWNKDWLRSRPEEWMTQEAWHDEPHIVTNAENTMITFIYTGPFRADVGSYNWHIRTPFGEKRIIAQTSYQCPDAGSFVIHLSDMEPYAIAETETLPGQMLSLFQARTLAESMAASVLPDSFVEREGVSYGVETDGTINNHKAAYWFGFTRRIGGMPVTMTSNTSLGNIEDESSQRYESSPKVEMLVCVVDQDRIVMAEFINPWNIGEAVRGEVQLLPFDQVLEVFAAIAPLSIQGQEGDKDALQWAYSNDAWIHEIRLGYMPVLAKNGNGSWELRPVWDFFGTRTFGATVRDEAGLVILTIDAIDGTVIDRNYGY